MTLPDIDRQFAGAIPQLYERYLVPLIFDAYAADLAERLAPMRPAAVLELAAGTGVVTRRLSEALPGASEIIATDLNPPMLEEAKARGTRRPVTWEQADAQQLPFENGTFDAVVCQFGVMFFPDKVQAFSEARRVLRPGGVLLFNVWDALRHNEFAHAVTEALAEYFPLDPPAFLARVPHGYHDPETIASQLEQAGFTRRPEFATVAARSRAPSPRFPAVAYCQGTPLRSEIEQRAAGRLDDATDAAAVEIERRFGPGPVDAKMQALVASVMR